MVQRNEHTGDKLQTKTPSDEYRLNYDLIFNKEKQQENQTQEKDSNCQSCTSCNCKE